MQPYQPPLSHFYADSPTLKSRVYVQLFSWFGLLIAFLSLIQGRSLALLHLPLFALGIYASWDAVLSRAGQLRLFALGCVAWAVLDAAYVAALLASTSGLLRGAAVDIVAGNTFADLAPALDKLLQRLGDDAHFFVIFAAVTGTFFDAMAAYWAFALHRDIVEIVATTAPSSSSLLPTHAGAAGAGAGGGAGLGGGMGGGGGGGGGGGWFGGGGGAGAGAMGLSQGGANAGPPGQGGPLGRQQPHVPGRSSTIGGFGTFSRATQSTQTSPRTLHPFAGRGFRLGAGDPPQ